MKCLNIVCTSLHIIWHVAFLLTNVSAIVTGWIDIEGCSIVLAYWALCYGSLCLLYYIFAVVSAMVCYVREQSVDSQNKSFLHMIKLIQEELGIKDGIDLSEINISLSSNGDSRMKRGIFLNLVFGLVFTMALATGCMILGMTPMLHCNHGLYVVSLTLMLLTFTKNSIYFVLAFVS
jgi:hypothetical protein